MRKALAFGLGIMISATAFGQDLLQCANPDVVNSLVLVSSDGGTITTSKEIPEQLRGVVAPRGFAWIGTRVTDRDTRAAFRTDLGAAAARAAYLASLRAAGFALQDASPAENPGFELTSPPFLDVACRDGTIGVAIVRDEHGARFLTMTFNHASRPQTCEEALRTPRSRSSRGFAYLPGLALPPEIRQSTRAGSLLGGVGSGSGEAYTTMIEVEGVQSMSALASGLGEQLLGQGWTADGTWSGAVSTGSAWVRQTDDGIQLAGKLEVRQLSAEHYALEFKLVVIG